MNGAIRDYGPSSEAVRGGWCVARARTARVRTVVLSFLPVLHAAYSACCRSVERAVYVFLAITVKAFAVWRARLPPVL